jgi:hypothetical protein
MPETFTDDEQELRTRTARLPADAVAALAARYRGAPDDLWGWLTAVATTAFIATYVFVGGRSPIESTPSGEVLASR